MVESHKPKHGQERNRRQEMKVGLDTTVSYRDSLTGKNVYYPRIPLHSYSAPVYEKYCGVCEDWKIQQGLTSMVNNACQDCGISFDASIEEDNNETSAKSNHSDGNSPDSNGTGPGAGSRN